MEVHPTIVKKISIKFLDEESSETIVRETQWIDSNSLD